jgi:uncharacterized membrane protein
MDTRLTARAGTGALSFATVWGAALTAGAQGVPVPGPTPGGTNEGMGVMVPLVLAVVFIGIIVAAVRIMDRRRRRRDEASAIEASLSDALLREPRLAGTVITTTAHLPFAGREGPRVEVRGEVPYAELRDIAIRVVREELMRFHPDAHVEDRIFVAPHISARSA